MTDGNVSFELAKFSGAGYDKGGSVCKQVAWLFISSVMFRPWYVPRRLRVIVLRCFGASVGRGVVIKAGVKIHWPWKIDIGDWCWLGEDSWFINLEQISIGSNSCVSQGAVLCTGSHDRRSLSFEFDNAPIRVGDHCWIALGAVLLRGVTLGDRVTVGSRVVVRKSVGNDEMVSK